MAAQPTPSQPRLNRPYQIPELARIIGMDAQKLRRWLLRSHLAQPDIGGVVKGPNGWMVPSVAKLTEYTGWGAVAKRFVTEDDATKLQERVRDQDKQIQALRARVGAVEREHKIFLALVKKVTGVDLTDEVSVQEALSRSSRTTTA